MGGSYSQSISVAKHLSWALKLAKKGRKADQKTEEIHSYLRFCH